MRGAQPVTAPAEAPRQWLPGAVWITWENQRRNEGIATALGVPLFVFDYQGSRARRYLMALWRTLRIVTASRPRVMFVQNPSVLLAFTAVTFGPWLGARVVVDAHNAAIIPLQSPSGTLLRWVARYIIRRASLTLITNASLAKIVAAAGGRPFILPDRIPVLPAPNGSPRLPGRTVLFICTFASDEPFMEVIEAARSLDPSVHVYVTGNPRHRAAALKAMAPDNVTLTGFLPEADYLSLLQNADVVIDLTTREDCLVCGAYEAVSAGRPLILSDTAVNREYFSRGVCYTDNSSNGVAEAIKAAIENAERMSDEVRSLRKILVTDWERRRSDLVRQLGSAYQSGVAS